MSRSNDVPLPRRPWPSSATPRCIETRFSGPELRATGERWKQVELGSARPRHASPPPPSPHPRPTFSFPRPTSSGPRRRRRRRLLRLWIGSLVRRCLCLCLLLLLLLLPPSAARPLLPSGRGARTGAFPVHSVVAVCHLVHIQSTPSPSPLSSVPATHSSLHSYLRLSQLSSL